MPADPVRPQRRRDRGEALRTEDAFFLSVETPNAPQHVGGLAVLEPAPDGGPTLDQVRQLARAELGRLPRFARTLTPPARRLAGWHRARWAPADPDWSWHVTEQVVDHGLDGARAATAALAAEPLPRDRPLWRLVLLRDRHAGPCGLLLLLHHCVADGVGTLVQTVNLLRPRIELAADPDAAAEPGPLRRAAGTVAGLAALATDGTPAVRLRGGSARRGFGIATVELAQVQAVARAHRARVTDVLLCLLGDAIAQTQPGFAATVSARLRVAVPLMVRNPRSDSAGGNVTAAVMVDVPTGPMPTTDRLGQIRRAAERLRTPTRALASRFVMADLLRVVPEPVRRWFAHTVYGPAFFQAIVSNLPGPTDALSLAGAPVRGVAPVLPLAPGAPLAVGALSWDGVLMLGIATDPEVVDADALAGAVPARLRALAGQSAGVLHSNASSIRARARGESSASPKHSRS